MKTLRRYLFLVLPIMALSCSKEKELVESPMPTSNKGISATESILTNEELSRLVLFEENNTHSEQEIIKMAEGLLERMKGINSGTRAVHTSVYPIVKHIITLPSHVAARTVSPIGSQKIYILGYDGADGFCMIADDKRLSSPVLMYSEEGNANLPMDQPGFQYVMDILKSFVGEQAATIEAMRGDSVYQTLATRYDVAQSNKMNARYVLTTKSNGKKIFITEKQINDATFADTTKSMKGSVSNPRPFTGPNWTFPKLTEEWGQNAPFNTKAPNKIAGCNAVAVGMVLHKWYKNYTSVAQHTIPGVTAVIAEKYQWKSYSNEWFEWPSDINNSTCLDISQLMYDINSSQNLAAIYTWDGNGTAAAIEDCSRTFRNMGTLANDCTGYNAETLYSVNGDISVVGGKVAGTTYGHTWVIDSMARVNGTLYAHCNWGYDGNGNAMCNANAFQRAGQQYTQNLKMIRNITHTRRR